jgi:tRNA(Ser,Leu) C12 N-acetylase TAN1
MAAPSVPAAGLGRLDASTPAVVTTRRRGNLDAGHLDVESSVGADVGDGREPKCIGVREMKVIVDLGQPILVLITLTVPFNIFTAASHSRC